LGIKEDRDQYVLNRYQYFVTAGSFSTVDMTLLRTIDQNIDHIFKTQEILTNYQEFQKVSKALKSLNRSAKT